MAGGESYMFISHPRRYTVRKTARRSHRKPHLDVVLRGRLLGSTAFRVPCDRCLDDVFSLFLLPFCSQQGMASSRCDFRLMLN